MPAVGGFDLRRGPRGLRRAALGNQVTSAFCALARPDQEAVRDGVRPRRRHLPHVAAIGAYAVLYATSSDDARGCRRDPMLNTSPAVLAVPAALIAQAVLKHVFLPFRILRGMFRRRPAAAGSS